MGYFAIDATGVRQKGPQGEAAEGLMAYVGMIFNPLPDRELVPEGRPQPGALMKARYVSGLYPLAEMGPLLCRQGAQVGPDRAEVWVALTDGGAGLQDFVRLNFPRVGAVVLDFYHAAEYLATLATALHPTDAALAQATSWSRLLRDESGHAMIGVLESWEWPSVKGLHAVRAEVLGYFGNQVDRMDYPTYEANGWCIRLLCRGERVQDRGRPTNEGFGDAMERKRCARTLSRPRVVP